MTMITRRSFMASILAAAVAPYVVTRAGVLMPVRSLELWRSGEAVPESIPLPPWNTVLRTTLFDTEGNIAVVLNEIPVEIRQGLILLSVANGGVRWESRREDGSVLRGEAPFSREQLRSAGELQVDIPVDLNRGRGGGV